MFDVRERRQRQKAHTEESATREDGLKGYQIGL